MKVSEYFEEWLADQRVDFQKSTYESCTVYFRKHIIPWFEEHQNTLERLTPRDIKDYINYKQTGGRLDGKEGGLSKASVSKHLHLIKQALNDAVIMDYIPKSPAQYIKLKRSKNTVTRGAVMLTTEQAQKVINAFKGHYLYELVVVAFYYGLRRSEVLGLRWSAIDFDNNTLTINHTVVKSLTIEAKDSTKTEGSNATYDLLPNVKEILLRLRERKPPTSDYIFSHDNGTVLRPDSVTKAFSRVLKNNKLEHMRFHDIRHSTASLLFDMGMSLEDVKQWLRHSDIETTSNIYLHYTRTRKKITAAQVNDLFAV